MSAKYHTSSPPLSPTHVTTLQHHLLPIAVCIVQSQLGRRPTINRERQRQRRGGGGDQRRRCLHGHGHGTRHHIVQWWYIDTTTTTTTTSTSSAGVSGVGCGLMKVHQGGGVVWLAGDCRGAINNEG